MGMPRIKESLLSAVHESAQLESSSGQKYPSSNLATIKMVEDVLRKNKVFRSQNHLSRNLPKQVNHQSLKVVLQYLYDSRKITFLDGKIVWIFSDIDHNDPYLKSFAEDVLADVKKRVEEK